MYEYTILKRLQLIQGINGFKVKGKNKKDVEKKV